MKIEEVLEFFKKHYTNYHIQDKNYILNNINVDYLDMIDIFEEFAKNFEIEQIEKLDINKFFYKLKFIDSIKKMLNIKINDRNYIKKPPITIAHMIEVAKRKEWFDPE